MGFKVWVVGEEVLAADFNSLMQEQVIATFANAAARDAAITAPKAGQHAWLTDRKTVTRWDGAVWLDGAGPAAPRGVLSLTSRVTDQLGVGATPVDVGGLTTGALTIPANRYIQLSAWTKFDGTVAADFAEIYIVEGSSVLATGRARINVAGQSESLQVDLVLTPTAGAHTYKLQVGRNNAGTGTIGIRASASGSGATAGPAQLLCSDVGGF